MPTVDETNLHRTDGWRATRSNDETGAIERNRWNTPVRRAAKRVTLDGDRVKIQQQWECIVLSVDIDVVSCEMLDLNNEANPTEFAEIVGSRPAPATFCNLSRLA